MPESTEWGREVRERNAAELASRSNPVCEAMDKVIHTATQTSMPIGDVFAHTSVTTRAVTTEAGNCGIVYEQYRVTIERLPFKDDQQKESIDCLASGDDSKRVKWEDARNDK